MTLFHGYDASVPPDVPFPGAQAAFGYLGPVNMTPHVWTAEEWNEATLNGSMRCGPFWVADFLRDVQSQAIEAVGLARRLGWRSDRSRVIMLDSETSDNVAFINEFGRLIFQGGFLLVDYRSFDAIIQHPSDYPEFVAHYNVPPGPFTPRQVAYQYKANVPWAGTKIDLDLFDTDLWDRLGRGRRHVQ